MTGPQLHKYISTVKKAFPDIPVGTADSWNKFADGTADDLFTTDTDENPMVTYVLANAFAYWQGTAADKAHKTYFNDMAGAMKHIQKLTGDKASKIKVINGETGWPTGMFFHLQLLLGVLLYAKYFFFFCLDGGTDYEAAKAGTKNAETFWKKGVCGMLDWGVDLFYFEAFDESWKPDSTGDNGQPQSEKYWGLFTDDRSSKFDTSCPK